MPSAIKNHTSQVPVERTIARIEEALAKAGIVSIEKEYSTRATVAALRFTLPSMAGADPMKVRLPVNIPELARFLYMEHTKPKPRQRRPRRLLTEDSFYPQAARTAWKLMQDWVEVQLSLIALQQAQPAEVFLPFLWNGRETVFSALQSGGSLRRLLTM